MILIENESLMILIENESHDIFMKNALRERGIRGTMHS